MTVSSSAIIFFFVLNLTIFVCLGGFLLGRSLALLTTRTLATSMAARQGPIAMAAHQIYLQVWLVVSLITDVLSSYGQVHGYVCVIRFH